MAGYISDGNADIPEGMKWIIVPPHERAKPEDVGDNIFDGSQEIFDLNVPTYKLVPLDDPRPDAPDTETGGNASQAEG